MSTQKGKKRAAHKKPLLNLVSEAVHLVRNSGPAPLVAYLTGALPFVLGLVYFWGDMSRSAFASKRCFSAAFGMALLFIWMKCWQAVYAKMLMSRLTMSQFERPRLRELGRMLISETVIQPHGLYLIPLSMLMTIPFPTVYAFFQNVTLLALDKNEGLRDIIRKSWRYALKEQGENLVVLWLFCPWVAAGVYSLFYFLFLFFKALSPFVFFNGGGSYLPLFILYIGFYMLPLFPLIVLATINVGVLITAGPYLLKTLLGIDSVFTLAGSAIVNSTFLALIFALTYLSVDPFAKAGYVLRRFYADSIISGMDMKVALDELRRREEGR